MKTKDAILWFKNTFGNEGAAALAGTPFSVDLLVAIAYQETGYIWQRLVGKVPMNQVLELCVGDVINAPKRSAFPKTKQALLDYPDGPAMFKIAKKSLEEMSVYAKEYQPYAKKDHRFCHGFGVFQYDIQFFKKDPQFFLQKKWGSFTECLKTFVHELHEAMGRLKWSGKTELSDVEQVYVAIAYNAGSADPKKGLKQGHYNKDDKRYYGENVMEFLMISKSLALPPAGPTNAALAAIPKAEIVPEEDELPVGSATLPLPTPVESELELYRVDVRSVLRLREGPGTDFKILARLPAGHLVRRAGGKKSDPWREVETSISGGRFRGFVDGSFLVKVSQPNVDIPIVVPDPAPPTTGIVAVYAPQKAGHITARSAIATAYSLNEAAAPKRKGDNAAKRVEEIAEIINWLAVDKVSHKRYQPRAGKTFCNIYAHDFCMLAGAYLPRVWWSSKAIERLTKGEKVEPLLESTIDELRANDLFRWLRDYGPTFGWRRTSSLSKLQEAANVGGLGLIVARRVDEGKSGHIVVIVPEGGGGKRALRNSQGEVTAPLQSQAGARNFRAETGKKDWWLGEQFEDSAFWIHG